MSIQIDQEKDLFLLNSGGMSYGIKISNGMAFNLYWGAEIKSVSELPELRELQCHRHRKDQEVSLQRQEYPVFFGNYFQEVALKANFPDGIRSLCPVYEGFEHNDETLILHFGDENKPFRISLCYRVWHDYALIDRWCILENRSAECIELERFASAAWNMPDRLNDWRISSLAGHWGKEAQIEQRKIPCGQFVMESRTGLSSSFCLPFFALDEGQATESDGEVYFGTVQWIGNWKITVDRGHYDQTVVLGGLQDFDSRIILQPGEAFETPVFTAGYTTKGFGGMSREFHRLEMDRLLPPEIARKNMPVIFNSWGCFGINVNEENIIRSAERAALIGAELFVIDDGWQSALGDWVPDSVKFPDGLGPVIEKVRALGMELGLWVEIESYEKVSELYRAHPEWTLQYPGLPPVVEERSDIGRQSVMLNFARKDVTEYFYHALYELLASTGIRYLKLDMNCYITTPDKGGRFWIDYARNLESIFVRLTCDFPEVLFENCAAGGGRTSLAMNRYFGRMNRSDNQDAHDVLLLHEGFTWLNHSRMAGGGCNISDSMFGINKRKVPYDFQAACGSMGSLSCGVNLLQASDEKLAEIRKYTDRYKELRHITNFGDLYRIVSPRENPYAVFAFLSRNRNEAVIFVLGLQISFADKVPRFRIPDLKPDSQYEIKCYNNDVDKVYGGYTASIPEYRPETGRMLAQFGLRAELVGDYDYKIFHLKEIL